MKFRIEKMDELRIVGHVIHSTMENGACYKDVGAFWGKMMQDGRQMGILSLMNRPPYGLIGVNVYNVDENDAQKFDYYIACSTDQPVPEGMAEYLIPSVTWAVFPCKREGVNQVEVQIVTEWLPTSGYKLLNSGYETGMMQSAAPDLEVYAQGDAAEVWVAVEAK